MQKSWFLVGVFMGWDTGFKCVSTEKWCFSDITLHPLGVIHNTTGFILLKPRPTRRTFSSWKRTCRSWEVTYWMWPTSQLALRARARPRKSQKTMKLSERLAKRPTTNTRYLPSLPWDLRTCVNVEPGYFKSRWLTGRWATPSMWLSSFYISVFNQKKCVW